IDWMAKRGATGFLFIRHANDTQWVIPELVRELGRRGLDLEGGGHVLVELLPRALFAAHPEYFPCAPGGGRFDLGNVCTASPGASAATRTRSTIPRARRTPRTAAPSTRTSSSLRAASTCSSTTATRSSSAAARYRSPRSWSGTSTATPARACAASPASSSDSTACGRTA